MPWYAYPLIALVIALVVRSIMAAAKAARERREALAAFATRLGWSFTPDEDRSIPTELGRFEQFQQGHSRAGFNTMRGYLRTNGRQFDIVAGDFTYQVTTSTGKTTVTTTYEFSYIVAECPFPRVPDLLIRREGFLDRIGAAFGMNDINFESAEFSRAFCVKSPDRKFAFDVIHPRMIEFLMSGKPPQIELSGGLACFATDNSLWTPAEFQQQVAFVAEFFALWPQYLLDNLEARR